MELPLISTWTGALGSLLRKLQRLSSDHSLKPVVSNEIQSLRDEIVVNCRFLIEMSSSSEPTMAEKRWTKQVRELSYDVDDFLFAADLTLTDEALIGSKLPEFRARAQEAIQLRLVYCQCHPNNPIPSTSSAAIRFSTSRHHSRRRPYTGMLDEIAGWVKGGEEVKVVGIVGEDGGIGKTTLAAEVYRRLGGQFQRRAFVRMAEKATDMRRLLKDLISQLDHHHHHQQYLLQLDTACDMPDLEQWNICNSLASNLRRNSTREVTRQILNLNYNNLPHYLKTCLLYLNIYPADYTILKVDLLKQWIAEGFVEVIKDQDLEETAGNYFDELVERRMIQPVDVDYDDKVLSCTVHSMIHDLIAHRSIEDNLIIILDNFQNSIEISDKVRRLSLHFGNARYAKTPEDISFSQVRTLGFFGAFKCLPSLTEFKILQVLILYAWGDTRMSPVIDLHIISELHKLRYLKVSCDSRIKLPTRISKLQCLETLDIEVKIIALPSDIVHLPHLLHLRLPDETNLPDGIGMHMTTLLTLVAYLDLSTSNIEHFQSLAKLISLRDLHLTFRNCNVQSVQLLGETMKNFGFVIESLAANIKSVTLAAGFLNEKSTNRLNSTESMSWKIYIPPRLLQRLDLSHHVCTFSTLPIWIRHLGNLCILKIAVRKLSDGDIDVLSGLSALTVLSLHVRDAPEERIILHKTGFPVLSYFKFKCSVANLVFEERAMPSLRRLVLGFCAGGGAERQPTPAGMEHLLCLEEVTARIDGSCANEADRMDVESALKNVVTARNQVGGITPVVNIRWVDRGPEEQMRTASEDQSAAHNTYPMVKNEERAQRNAIARTSADSLGNSTGVV
uniref:NB-ARC domain-containing protein n=1 Tax=Leersia perrieri TaxID=77586 RepID=A0A0D9XIX8_9ORYZ